jgi:hypothetical protein
MTIIANPQSRGGARRLTSLLVYDTRTPSREHYYTMPSSRSLRVLLIGFVLLNLLGLTSIFVSHSFFVVETENLAIVPQHNASMGSSPEITRIIDVDDTHSRLDLIPDNATTTNNKSKAKAAELQKADKKQRSKTLQRLAEVGALNISTILQEYSVMDLPPWSEIERKYGPPTILGLETCTTYRQTVPQFQNRWVSPAGLFHTGTNLMANVLATTCLGVVPHWQVPWGKHNPAEAVRDGYKVNKALYNTSNTTRVLPIVLVRHPIDWFESMCKVSYTASWNRSQGCPALELEQNHNPVTVGLYQRRTYNNLLELWTHWNAGYLYNVSSFPRLIVRLEDLVYHPETVLNEVCRCAGGIFKSKNVPTVWNARQGGTVKKSSKLPLVEAWKRHAQVSLVSSSLSSTDQQVVRNTPDLEPLLDLLHYKLE